MKLSEAIDENKTFVHCPICHEQHESVMYFGKEMVGCPEVPMNVFIPFNKREDGQYEIALTLP